MVHGGSGNRQPNCRGGWEDEEEHFWFFNQRYQITTKMMHYFVCTHFPGIFDPPIIEKVIMFFKNNKSALYSMKFVVNSEVRSIIPQIRDWYVLPTNPGPGLLLLPSPTGRHLQEGDLTRSCVQAHGAGGLCPEGSQSEGGEEREWWRGSWQLPDRSQRSGGK